MIQPLTSRSPASLPDPKDGVASFTHAGFNFQLVDQLEPLQLKDHFHEVIKAGGADDAIDGAILVTDADLHILPVDCAQVGGLRIQFCEDGAVDGIRRCAGNKCGELHLCSGKVPVFLGGFVPLSSADKRYCQKYIRKVLLRDVQAGAA